jgi:hypothetical protein
MREWWASILLGYYPHFQNRETLTPFKHTLTHCITQNARATGEEENLVWRICVAVQIQVLWHERNRRTHDEDHLTMGSLCAKWSTLVRTELTRALIAETTTKPQQKSLQKLIVVVRRRLTVLEEQVMIPPLESTTLPWETLSDENEEMEYRLLVYE